MEPGKAPLMAWISDQGGSHGSHLEVPSVRRLARLLGTETKWVNVWLLWLHEQGLIDAVYWSENRRSVSIYLHKPRNI